MGSPAFRGTWEAGEDLNPGRGKMQNGKGNEELSAAAIDRLEATVRTLVSMKCSSSDYIIVKEEEDAYA